jgi:deoxyinosine 3'endonuclease (endonuclease V)
MVSLETAIKSFKHCAKNRIPEPLFQAHKLAKKERIRLAFESKVNITEN